MSASVALVVDHPRRDLPGLALVATALARAGVTCHLVPLNLQHRELWALAPDMVVLNYARHANAALAAALHGAGIAVAVLDTEGGVWAEPSHYGELLWRDATVRAVAAPLCIWGPRLAEYLVREGFFSPAQLRVTGSPRHDLYHPRWSSVWRDLQPREGRRRILINTNFTVTNPRFTTAAANRRQFVAQYAWDEERAGAVATTEATAIEAFIDLARALAADLPECTVVLRPHPFEDPERYARALAGTGVEINADGPVQPQILASIAVLQRGCSTAIEAALAGVPALSPRWIAAPIEIAMAEAVSEPCGSYETLRDRLRRLVAGDDDGDGDRPTGITAAAAAVLDDWFSTQDGRAHARVADALLAHLPGERRVDERACRRELYGITEPGVSRTARLTRHARRMLGVPPGFSLRTLGRERYGAWRASDKGFDADTVRPLLARIAAAAPGPRPVALPAASAGHYRSRHRGCAVTITGVGA